MEYRSILRNETAYCQERGRLVRTERKARKKVLCHVLQEGRGREARPRMRPRRPLGLASRINLSKPERLLPVVSRPDSEL